MAAEDHDGGRSPSVNPTRVDHSLDDLARGLASGTVSRGKALRWMGSALVGAALASVPGVAWADDCRRLGRECRRDSQCCSRNCIRRGDDKVCGCPTGQTRCNDRCVNLQRNENHCGSCFNRCPEGQECVPVEGSGGVCQRAGCPSGTTPCGANCVPNCPSGQRLNTSTCQCVCILTCGGECCPPGCGACEFTNEGQFCVDISQPGPTCESAQRCASNADCPAGYYCSVAGCPEPLTDVCKPICTGSGGTAVA